MSNGLAIGIIMILYTMHAHIERWERGREKHLFTGEMDNFISVEIHVGTQVNNVKMSVVYSYYVHHRSFSLCRLSNLSRRPRQHDISS